ncbi:MAG: hypothetical protein IPM18_00920 [Phycisphaerales bacterium]|nr:hypothetical protein [Phycisphaerales bacterium]
MKRMRYSGLVTGLMIGVGVSGAWASEAQTSASATGGRNNGAATATARYDGQVGFARTDTKTGKVNLARGVAVGVDANGLSLSLSHAIAPQHGPAIATNFNMSIGRDGEVNHSVGSAVATGGSGRTVMAGGQTQSSVPGRVAVVHQPSALHPSTVPVGGVVRLRSGQPIAQHTVMVQPSHGGSATSMAGGNTSGGGRVTAKTQSSSVRPVIRLR